MVFKTTKTVKKTSLKRLPAFAKDVKANKVTPALIEEIENYTLKNWVKPTVGRTHGDMLHVGNWAVKHGYCKKNPFDGLTRYATHNRETEKYIDEAIIRTIIANATCSDLRVIFALARFGGLRVMSELRQLTWKHSYRPDENVLIVRKSKARQDQNSRDIFKVLPLFPFLDAILTQHWESTAENSEFIITPKTLQSTDTAIRNRGRRAIKRAGYEPWAKMWQNLRLSFANDVRQELNVEQGAKLCGHTEAVALQHYKMNKTIDVNAAIKSGLFGV